MLIAGGRVAYEGPPGASAAYFERLGFHRQPTTNPCDHVLDVACGIARRAGTLRYSPALLGQLWQRHGGSVAANTATAPSTPPLAVVPPKDGMAAETQEAAVAADSGHATIAASAQSAASTDGAAPVVSSPPGPSVSGDPVAADAVAPPDPPSAPAATAAPAPQPPAAVVPARLIILPDADGNVSGVPAAAPEAVAVQLASPPPSSVRKRPNGGLRAAGSSGGATALRAASALSRSREVVAVEEGGGAADDGTGRKGAASPPPPIPSPIDGPTTAASDVAKPPAVALATTLRWLARPAVSGRRTARATAAALRLPDAGLAIVTATARALVAVLAVGAAVALQMQNAWQLSAAVGGAAASSTQSIQRDLAAVEAQLDAERRATYIAFVVLALLWLAGGCGLLGASATVQLAPARRLLSCGLRPGADARAVAVAAATCGALAIAIALPPLRSVPLASARVAFAVLAACGEAAAWALAAVRWHRDQELAGLRVKLAAKAGQGDDWDFAPPPPTAAGGGAGGRQRAGWLAATAAVAVAAWAAVAQLPRRSLTCCRHTSSTAPPPAAAVTARKPPPFRVQFAAFLRRAWLQELAAIPVTAGVLLLLAVVGAAVGAVFRGVSWLSWSVRLLLVELIIMLSASTSGVTVVVSERALAEHEAGAGASIGAYALARQLVSAPTILLLQPFFFLVPYVQGGEPFASFTVQLGLLACLAFAASGIGNVIGVAAPRAPYLLACIAIVFVGVFSSYSPTFATLETLGFSPDGARALLAWAPMRWVSEGLLLAEVQGLPPGWAAQRAFLPKQYGYYGLSSLTSGAVYGWPFLAGVVTRLAAVAVLHARVAWRRK